MFRAFLQNPCGLIRNKTASIHRNKQMTNVHYLQSQHYVPCWNSITTVNHLLIYRLHKNQLLWVSTQQDASESDYLPKFKVHIYNNINQNTADIQYHNKFNVFIILHPV
jgi:hypothetical protein